MKTSEIIENMLALLNNPGRWKAGEKALNVTGTSIDPCSPHACTWSVEGACIRASKGDATRWAEVKKIILQFRPPLGANGEAVNYLAVVTLLMGCYHYAYLQEMSSK